MLSVNETDDRAAWQGPTSAFLLAQVGAHAAARFAQRISGLGLTPPHAGLLRLIATEPGQSQQQVAGRLHTPPSRLVLLIDQLQDRGLIERRNNPDDRRHHALYLTGKGSQFLGSELGPAAAAHEEDICAALTGEERQQLHRLLTRIAAQQQLTEGIHPGYRQLRP